MIEPIDFSQRQNFPGVEGNQFDVILKASARIQQIPAPLFALGLFLWALLITWGNWPVTLSMLAFFYSDWLLLELLPKFKKSYGPPKPPIVILTLLRSIFLILPFQANLAFQIVGTGLILYGFYYEPHHIHLTKIKFSHPKIKTTNPIRLLHLGDLHIERITNREKELNRMIKEISPDIILFSGDILNLSYLKDPKSWQDAQEIISHWKAPYGVFMVSGSPAVDLSEIMPDLTEKMQVRWLKDEKTTLQIHDDTLDLIGLTCTHIPHKDGERLGKIATDNPDNFTILLYHSPDLAPIAARQGIDLQLSGHTHGGQVRLPLIGSLVTGSLYGREFQAGRYDLAQMVLYITRGIGLEGAGAPRVRFLCPPEIILWEISTEK